MATPVGMVFTVNFTNGTFTPQNFQDASGTTNNAETLLPGDNQLVVTGVPQGTSAATVAALLLSSPVTFGFPFTTLHWQVTYASLGSLVRATNF